MTDTVSSASCQLGIIRIWFYLLNCTCFVPVALLIVCLSSDPMLCMTFCPFWITPVSILSNLCAVLIALCCALPVFYLAIAVCSSSA